MSGRAFLDTNCLLYIASADAVKANRTEALLKAGAVISVQVLNEAARVCTRKLGMSWDETEEFLHGIRAACQVEPVTIATHELGCALAKRYQFQIFDAMIVASALLAEADVLYTEDMQDGFKIDKRLTLRNPFRTVR